MNEVWAREIEGREVSLVASDHRTDAIKIRCTDNGMSIDNVRSIRLSHQLACSDGKPFSYDLKVYIELFHLYPDGMPFYTEVAVCKAVLGTKIGTIVTAAKA